jgi:tetratricopeptide (TPR) repeat protein
MIAGLLALATMALYWPVTGYNFVNLDDPGYVTDNPHVQSGLTWENARWAMTTLEIGLWHPLTWISHMLDCHWFGLRPRWHHLTALLLHAANTVLLFVVLRRMTGALWQPAVVAALFALHPLHVESVAWVAERKDVLSTFFVFLTLWAYARYVQGQRLKAKGQSPEGEKAACAAAPGSAFDVRCSMFDVSPSPPSTLHPSSVAPLPRVDAQRSTLSAPLFYAFSLVFFALGLLSKPMIVTLPLVLLLLDYWPLARFPLSTHNSKLKTLTPLLLEKLPFVLLAALTGWITLQAAQGNGWMPSAARVPVPDRLANATLSYARYLLEVFWPGDLAVYYPLPPTVSDEAVVGAAVLLVGISVAAFWLAARRPYLAVGWLWYLTTLLPVIGLIQLAGYSHADRYTYVPLIGVFVGLSWGVGELMSRWRGLARACAIAGIGVVMLFWFVEARWQLACWQNSEILSRHALAATRDNWLAHNNLASALKEKGQIDEAIPHYQEALRLRPDLPDAYNNLGTALADKGQTDEAIRQFQEALRVKPDNLPALNNLGNALAEKGQLDEAIRQFQEAIRVNPGHAEAHYNLGRVFGRKGQLDEAINQFQEAIRLKPGFAEAHDNLGSALGRKGQLDEAIRQFQETLRLKPDDAQAHNNLGSAFYHQGRTPEAIAQFNEALHLKPNDPQAHNNLGVALAKNGQKDEAIRQYEEVLRLKPNDAQARNNLASLLAERPEALAAMASALERQGRYAEAIRLYQAALKTKPDQEGILNNFAWLLASCPDASLRNGPEAVRLATRACELSGYTKPLLIGTLAAAQAEAGDFPAAIATAEKAEALATTLGQDKLAARNHELIQLYRQGQPFHEKRDATTEGHR